MVELLTAIRKNAVGLAIFAMVTAGAIALTQTLTSERIANNIKAAEGRALNQIVPADSYDNDLLTDTLSITPFADAELLGPIPDNAVVYRARNQGQISAVILPAVAPDGYTTHIDMIVGIRADGSLAGVRVVAHRETPGLGDKIEVRKSDWIKDFEGKSLLNPEADGWAVKKDGGEFDEFTGATITPRAVVASVYNALAFFEQHRDELLDPDLNPARLAARGTSNGN